MVIEEIASGPADEALCGVEQEGAIEDGWLRQFAIAFHGQPGGFPFRESAPEGLHLRMPGGAESFPPRSQRPSIPHPRRKRRWERRCRARGSGVRGRSWDDGTEFLNGCREVAATMSVCSGQQSATSGKAGGLKR